MTTTLNPTSKADLNWYKHVMVPLWEHQQREVARCGVHYRWHLLAAECLNRAKGSGGDPLKVAEFCARWQTPMTLPVIGPVALIRKIGKAGGLLGELIAAMKGVAGPGLRLPPLAYWGQRTGPLQALSTAWPQIAIFDITGSINMGIKLIAAMAPLIARLQMRSALLIAMDSSVVPSGDNASVGQILQKAQMPDVLMNMVKDQQKGYVQAWADLFNGAEAMDKARAELGLPES